MSVIKEHLDTDGILTLTLNRPDKLNALNDEVLDSLADHCKKIKKSSKVRGLIITGEGKSFCAGADINRLAECNAESGYHFARQGQDVFSAIEQLGIPSIAAINGYAFGGGCEMAISTTIRVASNKAQFGQPEVNLGVIPGYGGTQRLARLIGKGRAMDLCVTGRFINADAALNWGLVSGVFEPEELLAQAKQIMNGILSNGPLAVKGVIEAINHGYDMSLNDALHLEAVHFAKVCASQDKNEGVSAFLEKRAADFKGN